MKNGFKERKTTKRERLVKVKSRMFAGLRTFNPYFGCNHKCYRRGCWAKKRLAHRLGSLLGCSDCYYFRPHFHPERLNRIPREPRIFVGAHCDLFGNWVPVNVIGQILAHCRATPKEMWFFETKNPNRYFDFLQLFPENTVLSTTIETNRHYPAEISGYTPPPYERFIAMLRIARDKLFPIHISIEPILDFDLEPMVSWMKALKPMKVAVGYDSLKNNLPEPSKEKTLKLITELETVTEVERK